MRKIFSFLILITISFGLIPENTLALNNTGYYMVTAYYSPLPNQDFYLTGDYELEKRLNGQGIRGASGKEVFSGMLAGPKTYTFGTKIYLEGLGVGVIEDRGGAIVTAGNRGYKNDRIDVWVGYGDEGLRRALYWGKRKVKGNIIASNSKVTLDYNTISSPLWATSGLNSQNAIFSYPIGVGSSKEKVKLLQEFLKDIGLYNGEIDGIYNSEVIDIVYNFQIENSLIKVGDTYGAGYWGKATRAKFKKAYLNGSFDKTESGEKTNKSEEKIIKLKQESNIFSKTVETKEEIKKLQNILKELAYYNGEITGDKKDLVDPIYDFQVKNNVVKGIHSAGAGFYGPKTRAKLKEIYSLYLEEKQKQEELRKQQEQRKKELEEKYRELEKYAKTQAEVKIKTIGSLKQGAIGVNVRELQLILKKFGYFKEKDTAIFGPKTKESLIVFQIENKVIKSENDLGAGIVGPKTLQTIKNGLTSLYLEEKLSLENIDREELSSIIGKEFES